MCKGQIGFLFSVFGPICISRNLLIITVAASSTQLYTLSLRHHSQSLRNFHVLTGSAQPSLTAISRYVSTVLCVNLVKSNVALSSGQYSPALRVLSAFAKPSSLTGAKLVKKLFQAIYFTAHC
jgi:hypothetical protein